MLDWTDIRLLLAMAGGLVLSLLLSTTATWKGRLVCVSSGLFFAFFGTEPLIHWAGAAYADGGFPYLIAGVLAMSGDRIARRVMQFADGFSIPLPWKRP